MSATINCPECNYITDIELTSETNPNHCPKCGGELMVGDIPLYGDDGEYNQSLFDNGDE